MTNPKECSNDNKTTCPSLGLLCKLGSAIVHADEAMSVNGVAEDEKAFRSVLSDPEIQKWLGEMHGLALLPVKRVVKTNPTPSPEAVEAIAPRICKTQSGAHTYKQYESARQNARSEGETLLSIALTIERTRWEAEVRERLEAVKRYRIGSDSEIGPPEPYEDREGGWVWLDDVDAIFEKEER